MENKSNTLTMFDILQEYENIQNPTSKHVSELINKAFDEIICKTFILSKNFNILSLEEIEDTSDLIIEMADSMCITLIRRYSLDVMDASYRVSLEKLNKLKKHLSKILLSKTNKESLLNGIFRFAFMTTYAFSVVKASDHRKSVLQEKGKQNNPENN